MLDMKAMPRLGGGLVTIVDGEESEGRDGATGALALMLSHEIEDNGFDTLIITPAKVLQLEVLS